MLEASDDVGILRNHQLNVLELISSDVILTHLLFANIGDKNNINKKLGKKNIYEEVA